MGGWASCVDSCHCGVKLSRRFVACRRRVSPNRSLQTPCLAKSQLADAASRRFVAFADTVSHQIACVSPNRSLQTPCLAKSLLADTLSRHIAACRRRVSPICCLQTPCLAKSQLVDAASRRFVACRHLDLTIDGIRYFCRVDMFILTQVATSKVLVLHICNNTILFIIDCVKTTVVCSATKISCFYSILLLY